MVCFAIRAGKLQALRQPSNKIARLAFALPLSVLLFLPCHLSRFMFSPCPRTNKPGGLPSSEILIDPLFLCQQEAADDGSASLCQQEAADGEGDPEEERGLCQINRHISAPRVTERFRPGVGDEVTDPHPSSSKRQSMGNPEEERALCQIKRYHSTPGQAATVEASEARGCATCLKSRVRISEARVRMSQANKNWDNLSKTAQARHFKNDIRARVRSMIPGIGSVSENSLMLQAAARIKQLEIEIDSVANHLERLQEAHGSNGAEELDNILKDQNVPAASLGEGFEPRALDLRADGHEALRAVLPLPSKARGTRLLELASQYMSELTEEKNMKDKLCTDSSCAASARGKLVTKYNQQILFVTHLRSSDGRKFVLL